MNTFMLYSPSIQITVFQYLIDAEQSLRSGTRVEQTVLKRTSLRTIGTTLVFTLFSAIYQLFWTF